MISINPKDNSERENYKLLTGTIIPRPIAFVTTLSVEKIVNGAPFSYFNIVCSNPPMIAISISRRNDQLKDTARNIYNNKEFVVHIVDQDNVQQINETAATLPYNESELTLANLTKVKSTVVDVPGIKESKARLECKLVHSLTLGGSGENPASDLFIGEVVHFHFEEEVYDNGYVFADKLDAVSRLAGNDYASLGERFTIERPK